MSVFERIKDGLRLNYARGDYGVIGSKLVLVAEHLCETVDLRGGTRVLDVATGHGNAALAAARRGAQVTAVDLVPELLEKGRARAAVEGLAIEFGEADAENLPFPDASFDFVLSTFGVQFSPDHARAAAELVRVCRPGGRIGLASWTPHGFSTAYAAVLARYAPPSPAPSPYAWGTDDGLRTLFGDDVASLYTGRRLFRYRFARPEDWLNCFLDHFGPMQALFAAQAPDRRERLAAELHDAVRTHNEADDGTLVLPIEYAESVAVRR